MKRFLKSELRERRRASEFKNSMDFGGKSVGKRQLYSGRPYCEYGNYGISKDPEQFKEEAMITLDGISKTIGLRDEIVEDFKNGIVDVAYLDSKLNGHVIHLEDDPEFSEAAKKLEEEAGATAIIGFKWDGQHSPVFMAKREMPEVLYTDDNGMDVIPSGSSMAGMCTTTSYRYVQLGVYFWLDGQLFDDYFEFESHDGIPYPTVAFPGLAEQDGNTADKVVVLTNELLGL